MTRYRLPSLAILAAVLIVGCQNASEQPTTASYALPGSSLTNSTEPVQLAPVAHMNLDRHGRALRGYDPVAYFQDNKAVQGDKRFSVSWNDAKWWFSNTANLDAFVKAPEKYAPATGGFCTFGVVLSKKFDGDPNVWSISNGHLYVFLNEDVKTKFYQDEDGNVQKVRANWPSIKHKSPESLGS